MLCGGLGLAWVIGAVAWVIWRALEAGGRVGSGGAGGVAREVRGGACVAAVGVAPASGVAGCARGFSGGRILRWSCGGWRSVWDLGFTSSCGGA